MAWFSAAASIGRVKFEVEASPALTPSWKSTSWAKPKRPGANAGGDAGDESPTLGDDAPASDLDETHSSESKAYLVGMGGGACGQERQMHADPCFGGAVLACGRAHHPFVIGQL